MRMNSKNKKRLVVSVISAVIVMGVIAGFGMMLNVSAEKGKNSGMAASGDGQCHNCAGCKTEGTSSHYQDSCLGGCWSKGTIGDKNRPVVDAGKGGTNYAGYGFINDSDPNKIVFGDNFNGYLNSQDGGNRESITGGTLEGCGDIGATEFYYSALTDFSITDGKISANGVQTGLLPAGKYDGIGTSDGTIYNYNDTCGTSNLEMKKKYELAKQQYAKKGQTLPEWNEVSAFCYNSEEWEKPDPEDPKDPDPEPEEPEEDDPSTQELEMKGFWSQATIYIPEQNDIPERMVDSDNKEGDKQDSKVSLSFSTDVEEVEVQIWHNMWYSGKFDKRDAWENHTDYDKIPTHSSNYEVKITTVGGSGGGVNQTITGQYTTTGATSNEGCGVELEEGDEALNYQDEGKQEDGNKVDPIQGGLEKIPSDGQNRTTFKLRLQPGTTVKICSKNEHDNYKLNVTREFIEKVEVPQGEDEPPKYRPPHYHTEFGDSTAKGSSEACVEIYRANEDPKEGVDNLGSDSTGTNGSSIMYAGEIADHLSWNNKAEGHLSRRIVGHKSIAYLLKTSGAYDGREQDGNLPDRFKNNGKIGGGRVHKDPIEYYNEKNGGKIKWNMDIPEKSGGEFSNGKISDQRHETAKIKVPDYTGYKYCNTSGYEWRYYERIVQNDIGDWKPVTDIPQQTVEDGKYWTNYSSACRTIVKKPEVAFWNGGVKTTGGIISSTAFRYYPDNDGNRGPVIPRDTDSRTLFGSWSEYLAIANDTISGFASGAALSRAFISSTHDDADIYTQASFLTVANDSGTLGGASIPSNSSLLTRLENYLGNTNSPAVNQLASLPTSTSIDSSSGKAQIYVTSGDININDSLIIQKDNYNDIYEIPRLVIYTDGNVNIGNKANRIDAWILAPNGVVNTCSGFRNGTTETRTADDSHGGEIQCGDRQLKINGPVIAGGVQLNRTYGADPVSYREVPSYGDEVETIRMQSDRFSPAEIFSLGADDYLWAYAQAGRYNSSYTDAYTRELPPRY